MPRTKPDKQALLANLADHVLKHGLNTASLRPMAAAAGTSDRMLIYHFGSKDVLIAEVLEYLAAQMVTGLDTALPPDRFETEQQLIARTLGLLRSEGFEAHMRVWLDIITGAAQGQAAHAKAGHGIVQAFLVWLGQRHPDGQAGAPRALALIEGCLVLDAVGHGAISDLVCANTDAGD